MITIFTRKELLLTMDMKRQCKVCDMLAANGIKYTVKVTNLQSDARAGSRGRVGSLGIDQNFSREYKIYVHRKDYEKALMLVG